MTTKYLKYFVVMLALAGIINCVVIEPALAQLDTHHTEFSDEEAGHCDFICHASHHFWDVDNEELVVKQSLESLGSITTTFNLQSDPHLQAIFHPPAILA